MRKKNNYNFYKLSDLRLRLIFLYRIYAEELMRWRWKRYK